MKTLDEVVLQKYKPEHLPWLKAFELPKEQEKFTALPIKMLKITKERHPIVILHDNEPVGFFVLHSSDRVKDYTNNPKAMLLTALSINHSKQGRGFANKGMKTIESFVTQQFPACNEIILAVNHKNVPAQKLYEKAGFKDTGTRKIGRIGEQYIYNFIIK
ncbi:GNAT family N-acetyltransferase [Peribacillus muralis]|uniref:GNAT family N-acetyltransferase n=1 Tax=Peribacillus muralis TaxID=264697 RepID=UPI003CFDFE16